MNLNCIIVDTCTNLYGNEAITTAIKINLCVHNLTKLEVLKYIHAQLGRFRNSKIEGFKWFHEDTCNTIQVVHYGSSKAGREQWRVIPIHAYDDIVEEIMLIKLRLIGSMAESLCNVLLLNIHVCLVWYQT